MEMSSFFWLKMMVIYISVIGVICCFLLQVDLLLESSVQEAHRDQVSEQNNAAIPSLSCGLSAIGFGDAVE